MIRFTHAKTTKLCVDATVMYVYDAGATEKSLFANVDRNQDLKIVIQDIYPLQSSCFNNQDDDSTFDSLYQVQDILKQGYITAIRRAEQQHIYSLAIPVLFSDLLDEEMRTKICFDTLLNYAPNLDIFVVAEKDDYEYACKRFPALEFDGEKTFSELLAHYTKNIYEPTVYKNADINRSMYNRFKNGKNLPSKDSALKIAIVLKLSLDKAEHFLNAAGYSFLNVIPKDKIIRSFIARGVYDFSKIDEELEKNGLPLLHSCK